MSSEGQDKGQGQGQGLGNERKRLKEDQNVSSDSLDVSVSNDSENSNFALLFSQMCQKMDSVKQEMVSEIRGELQSSVANLKVTINELKEDNEKLRQKVEEGQLKREELEGELESLREIVNSQALAITEIQQYSRSSNLKMYGVAEVSSGNSDETSAETASQVIKLCKEKLDIDLKNEQIAAVHRIGPKKDNKPRSIIIRFVHKTVRNNILGARKALKKTGIVIAEDLCPTNAKIFHQLRDQVGNDVWTSGGKILIKLGKVIRRVDEENFGDIMREIIDGREVGFEPDGETPSPMQDVRGKDRDKDRSDERGPVREGGERANEQSFRAQRGPRRQGPLDWHRDWRFFPPGPQGGARPKLRGRGRGRAAWGAWGGGYRFGSGYDLINPEDY